MLDFVHVESNSECNAAIVWLHGLGADGHDFEPIAAELDLNSSVKYIFPHAPIRSVTINAGMMMRAWYDVDPANATQSTEEIATAAALVKQLMNAELVDIPAERTVLAGFSQGGVIAMYIALRSSERLAGLMALSTYLPDHQSVHNEVTFESVDIPIFLAHGTNDPMLPIAGAATARSVLTGLNYQVEWHQYTMGHEVCREEIADIEAFLNRVLN